MDRADLKMKRHSRKLKYRPPALNLVSMMDIFTILLLFLITLSGDESVIPPPTNLELPKSTSEAKPTPAVTIMITKDSVVVSGVKVARMEDLKRTEVMLIPGLNKFLLNEMEKGRFISSSNKEVKFNGKITILADKDIPFKIVKKVMFTATKSNFPHISLAVVHKD